MTHIAQLKPPTLVSMPRTMTSLEIATLTGKEHFHVLRDIREMLAELYPNPDKVRDPDVVEAESLSPCGPDNVSSELRTRSSEDVHPSTEMNPDLDSLPDSDHLKTEEIYVDSRNREQSMYTLDRELTFTLITGYSVTLRNLVVKRWLELEANHAQFRADIQTLSTSADRESSWAAALRLAQKQLLAATNQKALRAIRSALENGIPPGSTPASIAAATLEFYNKNAAKFQKMEAPDAKTTLRLLSDFDLASDSPAKRRALGQPETLAWSRS